MGGTGGSRSERDRAGGSPPRTGGTGGSRSERDRASGSPPRTGGTGPIRTCVACRAREARGSLLRVVVGPDGLIRPDPTGRAPGRGAYVHRHEECIGSAIRRGALARALRMVPDAGGAGRLLEALRIAGAATPGPLAAERTTNTYGRRTLRN
jgi:uncharacterized protein